MRRKSSVMMALVLSAGMLFAGCGSTETGQQADSAVLVDAQAAGRDTLVLSNQFVGSVSPQEQVYVIPFASGTVTEVNYNVGDYVNAGDVLFKIDDEGAQLQLTQAQLSVTSAQQQVDMANGVSQQSTDLQLQSAKVQAQSAYEQAQIAYFQAKDTYDEYCDMEDRIEELEEALKTASTVSGGNAANVTAMQTELATLQATISKMAAAGTTKETLNNYLLQAESGYRAAEEALNIANQSTALTQGEVRESTKEQTQTSLALAQLGVESAELALSYYTVTAPISGVIQSRSVEVKGIAASSSPAFVIANENTMTVTFNVSESVMRTLQVGDAVKVERNGEIYDGNITEVGVAVNVQTGLFQIKATVMADGETLPSGVSVKVSSDTYTAENEIIIPYDAVYFENEGSYVYTVQDGRAVKTYVTTGIFDDTNIQVTEGIAEGDIVITSWSPRLLNGVEVDAKVAETEGSAQ